MDFVSLNEEIYTLLVSQTCNVLAYRLRPDHLSFDVKTHSMDRKIGLQPLLAFLNGSIFALILVLNGEH